MRNKITPETIRTSTELIVHPTKWSTLKRPYQVIVVSSGASGFQTKLKSGAGHIRTFEYGATNWPYHKDRFEIAAYSHQSFFDWIKSLFKW